MNASVITAKPTVLFDDVTVDNLTDMDRTIVNPVFKDTAAFKKIRRNKREIL